MYDILTGGRWDSEAQLGTLVGAILVSLGTAAYGLYCMREILRCGVYWCTADLEAILGGESLHLGFMLALIGGGLALTFTAVLCRWPKRPQVQTAQPLPPTREHWQQKERSRQTTQVISAAFLAVIILPLLFFLSSTLPNSYHYFTAAEVGAYHTATIVKYSTNEFSSAWMSSWSVMITSSLKMNVFPDVVMYYLFLEVLAVFAVLAAGIPSFGLWLSRPALSATGLSRGETAVASMFVVLTLLWFWYWFHDHSYHYNKAWIDSSITDRLARTWGQTAVLYMGMLFLPASKNSLWLKAMGVSWERGVWVHRWLGILCLVCMVLHFLTFWVRFMQLNVFPHDAFSFLSYYQINNEEVGSAPTGDAYFNYTIGAMQLVVYPAVILISLSAWFRHGKGNNWEYFKYIHYIFLVLVPATLLHAASSWYFLLGGIAFYLIDASIRFVGVVSPPARLLKVGVSEADSGFTLLTFDKSHAEPGQFAWIRVPMISDWEWHPFSISSAPSDGEIKMCIKNMGPGTWTDSLFQLACEYTGMEEPLPVQLDGPYGTPLAPLLAEHAGVLLLAGGVGITQPHSVLRELAAYYKENKALPGGLKFVKLIWAARSAKTFEVFSSSISDCLSGIPESVMSAEFYLTKPGSSSSKSLPVTEGRPKFGELYEGGRKALTEDETLFVQACGPTSMVDEAAAAAQHHPFVKFDSALFVL